MHGVEEDILKAIGMRWVEGEVLSPIEVEILIAFQSSLMPFLSKQYALQSHFCGEAINPSAINLYADISSILPTIVYSDTVNNAFEAVILHKPATDI